MRIDIASSYRDALARYAADPGENSLADAYGLGREALAQGLGILDITAMHRDATLALVTSSDRSRIRQVTMSGMAFLLECLGPFEMALRGFNDALGALHSANERLEATVAERTRELEVTVAELRSTDRQRRELLTRLVASQEEERALFAHALHDDTIQLMTAVTMTLALVTADPTDVKALEHVRESKEVLELAIRRCRLLLFELLPRSLETDGLVVAVHELLRRSGDEARFTYEVEDRLRSSLPHDVEAVLFRVVQEAVANIRKHADASHVSVRIEQVDSSVRALVADDGRGFDAASTRESAPGHLGLTAMRDRVESSGGRLEIRSSHGNGCIVEAWLPSELDPDP